jgi:molecular chaperone Hsp33
MDKISAGYDQLTRFWLDTAPARGVVARLDESLVSALKNHDYPPAVVSLLRQLAGAAVLLASNLKQSAQVILQAQGTGDVPLLCVEATDALTFRIYASVREDSVLPQTADIATLVAPDGRGRFVLTISPTNGQMYQGIVALPNARGVSGVGETSDSSDGSIASLLEDYLSNSQQTHTRMWLREDGDVMEAMLLERLPDRSEDAATPAWNAVIAQADAIFREHFMPFPYSEWLQFSFSGHDVKVHPSQPVSFACSCSIQRVLNALKLVGEDELKPLIAENGKIETRCEFCGKNYEVSAIQFSELFHGVEAGYPPGTRTIQ